jgi:hypothetical protein
MQFRSADTNATLSITDRVIALGSELEWCAVNEEVVYVTFKILEPKTLKWKNDYILPAEIWTRWKNNQILWIH